MVLRAQSLGDQLVVAATCSQSPIVEKKKTLCDHWAATNFFKITRKQ